MGFQNCISNCLCNEILAPASYQNALIKKKKNKLSGGIKPVTLEMQVGFYFQSFRAVSSHSETRVISKISQFDLAIGREHKMIEVRRAGQPPSLKKLILENDILVTGSEHRNA